MSHGQNSIFNTADKLNKHPSLYLIFFKLVALNIGMNYMVDEEPLATGSFTYNKDRETNCILQPSRTAPNITDDEYSELSKRKKRGETTKEENATCDTYYWQKA